LLDISNENADGMPDMEPVSEALAQLAEQSPLLRGLGVALDQSERRVRELLQTMHEMTAAMQTNNEQSARLVSSLSSQSAILWMSMLFFISTVFYWAGIFIRGQADAMESLGSRMAWVAVGLALIGTLVRWYESHQLGPDIGHIPVSNLYEVFIMFCWMTAAFYLYYEEQYKTRALGAFVMLVVKKKSLEITNTGFSPFFHLDVMAQHAAHLWCRLEAMSPQSSQLLMGRQT
jgi:hypothetical protein